VGITIEDLRRFAVARSLFPPTTLKRALDRLGFVQADPIRAPARAQDLTLRHRVNNYRAGDLERRYSQLNVEEDFFVNYGFVPRDIQALMHPRTSPRKWSTARKKQADALLAFVRTHGAVHPREVDDHFSHGTVTNYWGGSSNATTYLLNLLHYHGRLRVAGRQGGIRIYAAHEHGAGPRDRASRLARIDALVDVLVRKYGPLPGASLSTLVHRLRYAVPQWKTDLNTALRRAKQRLSHARVGDVDWYWPAGESVVKDEPHELVRLLAPFDPVVWDRHRFERFWNWPYRFEAYTPVTKRKRGYYALPLLWRDRVIGWANISVSHGDVHADFGYLESPPQERAFIRERDAEIERMRMFLGL
jgi:uncharacterized protein YcaQ